MIHVLIFVGFLLVALGSQDGWGFYTWTGCLVLALCLSSIAKDGRWLRKIRLETFKAEHQEHASRVEQAGPRSGGNVGEG